MIFRAQRVAEFEQRHDGDRWRKGGADFQRLETGRRGNDGITRGTRRGQRAAEGNDRRVVLQQELHGGVSGEERADQRW